MIPSWARKQRGEMMREYQARAKGEIRGWKGVQEQEQEQSEVEAWVTGILPSLGVLQGRKLQETMAVSLILSISYHWLVY